MLTVHQRYRQTNGYRRTDRRTDARLVGDYARGPAESWGGPAESWAAGPRAYAAENQRVGKTRRRSIYSADRQTPASQSDSTQLKAVNLR